MSERPALKRKPQRRERSLDDLSRAELLERIRLLKKELGVYRLPSPERMSLIEELLGIQDRLLDMLIKPGATLPR